MWFFACHMLLHVKCMRHAAVPMCTPPCEAHGVRIERVLLQEEAVPTCDCGYVLLYSTNTVSLGLCLQSAWTPRGPSTL